MEGNEGGFSGGAPLKILWATKDLTPRGGVPLGRLEKKKISGGRGSPNEINNQPGNTEFSNLYIEKGG